MGDVINIKPIYLEENSEFVADCCRYQEGILTEARMKLKYGFADNVWLALGDNTALLEAVEDEKIRRVRSGRQKREKAQMLVVRAPDVAASIMLNDSSNDRHRLDACKVLNDLSANPSENTPAATSDRFVIQINLGSDLEGRPIIETYDKSIAIDVNDNGPVNDRTGKSVEHETGRPLQTEPVVLPADEQAALDALLGIGE